MKHKHKHIIMSFLFFVFFFFFILFSNGASGTSITVINDCAFTVWPGISSDPVLNITGFELTEGASRSLQAPANWSGRIWGRTGCTFNGSGPVSCTTGDCGSGEMDCNGRTFNPPVTIARLNISKYPNTYDVSIINGYNLPMTIETTGGKSFCPKTGCVDDLNQLCPPDLKLEGGGGCKSACQVFPSQDHCCTSLLGEEYSVNCNPTLYGQLFHRACPKSITYEYDLYDKIVSCNGGDYTVRFCPLTDTFSTIKLEGQLFSTDQLVSIGANFTLGFFGVDYSYLGIWYTNDVKSRKVWVANRNTPIISTSGNHALSIDPDTGNLIIVDGDTTLMRITDFDTGPNPNMTATLEDNGNFMLINEIDKKVLWQSFDHPTDVLLPGMKLGYDLTTGQNWTLTSCLSTEIPKTGDFTLSWESIEEATQRLIIRRQGQPYWTGGNKKFQFIFYLYGFKLTSVFNNEQRYISYNIDPDFGYKYDSSSLPMWILTQKGQINDGLNSKNRTPEFCYGYDDSGNGCVESSSLPQCRRKIDGFSYRNGNFSHKTSYTIDTNLSLSISDCFLKCWNDCGCVGFNSNRINGTGCIFWIGSNSFLDFPNRGINSLFDDYKLSLWDDTRTYVIRVRTPITGKKTEGKTKLILILIGTIIPLVCFLRLWLLGFLKKRENRQEEEEERRRRDKIFLELTASESFKDVHHLESNGGKGNDLLIFSFASIMVATNDFSIENKLGQGGFGPVYKGQLSDGQEIAIKRLSRTSGQGLVEFKNELILISKLQHTNLVRVLGCCIHREEKMLIYEYMPNKSLDFFLFDENRKVDLDWLKRYNIIEGIAQGLLYLHKYSRMRVIHRDLKANNILLDENMNPKISDFGMARMFKQNETEAMTSRVVGTFGYMSPEYIMKGTFSIKSDIFSFGVLILEIISGRKNSSFVHLDRTFNLIGYAWELWQQGNTLVLMDMTLRNTCLVQQFLRTVHVALLCVQESAMDRPTTSDMISMLLNDTVSLPAPNKPAFFISRVDSKSSPDENKPTHFSVNNMTITVTEGR